MVVPLISARWLVVILIVSALLMSGCTATKDDRDTQVLSEKGRTSETENGDDFSITVAKGTEVLRVIFDTNAASEGGIPGCGDWCVNNPYVPGDDGDDPVGHVEVLVDSPSGVVDWRTTMGHGAADRASFEDPEPGVWEVFVDYEDDYNGAFYMRAESTGNAAGGVRPLITDNMLEITGLLLTVGAIVTGAILYRRRGNFLRRELHKIDATVHLFKDDVDECRTNLIEMQDHLKELLVKRKIEDSHYLILEKRIDRYLADLDTPGNRHAGSPAASPSEPAARRGKPRIIEEPSDWEPL